MPRAPFSALLLTLALAACGGDTPPNIKVTRAPAQGLTATDMDAAYLAQLERWTGQAATERLDETYARNEVPPEGRTSRVFTDARYVDWQGKRLAVVDLAYRGSPVRVTRVTGLVGDTLVTVACTAPEGTAIVLTDPQGECGRVVAQSFR